VAQRDGSEFRTADDVDDSFAEAVVHSRAHRVLGFKLKPFSLWHAANLDFVESPFAGHKKPIDFGALLVAARICQLRFPDVLRKQHRLHLLDWWRLRKYRAFKFTKNKKLVLPLLAEINKFSAYLRDYASRPEYMSTEDSVPVKCPWYLFETAMLKRYNPAFTWAQCWDFPVGEAGWCNAAMHEAHGMKIELVTPEYRKAFKEAGYE
jgi:hypothetical protein